MTAGSGAIVCILLLIFYHHIAAATNIMLLTVQHDIVEREGTSSTSHIMMCCVMNKAAVDFLNKFERPVYTTTGSITSVCASCVYSKTAYYCPYYIGIGHGSRHSAWLVERVLCVATYVAT